MYSSFVKTAQFFLTGYIPIINKYYNKFDSKCNVSKIENMQTFVLLNRGWQGQQRIFGSSELQAENAGEAAKLLGLEIEHVATKTSWVVRKRNGNRIDDWTLHSLTLESIADLKRHLGT